MIPSLKWGWKSEKNWGSQKLKGRQIMGRKIFFPGCRIKKACPEASRRLAEYLKKTYGLTAAGCCKEDFALLNEEGSTAVLICSELPRTT